MQRLSATKCSGTVIMQRYSKKSHQAWKNLSIFHKINPLKPNFNKDVLFGFRPPIGYPEAFWIKNESEILVFAEKEELKPPTHEATYRMKTSQCLG